MRIRRGLLFWGLFLIPLGAVPLLVRAGAVDGASLTGAWRLWPVILIALGIALVAGRSQVALVGTVVTALILGIAAGGALATGNFWFGLGDCGTDSKAGAHVDQSGTFERPGSVRLELNCGQVQVSTQTGSAWTFHADIGGAPPAVTATADRLEIKAPEHGSRGQAWSLKVPTAGVTAVDLQANAGSGTIGLAGATISSLKADVNAFDLVVDGSEATIQRIDVAMNAGHARLTLGQGPLTGRLSVNAGAIEVCVPATAQLRIHQTDQITFATNLDERGLAESDGTWTRAGTGATIELTVDGAAAKFDLDPEGGCR